MDTRWWRSRRRGAGWIGFLLAVLVACSSPGPDRGAAGLAPPVAVLPTTVLPRISGTATTVPPTTAPADSRDCLPAGGPPAVAVAVQAQALQLSNGLAARGVVYPRPDYPGEPWSQWGQGVVGPDGRFFSAIGDHGDVDANSFVYRYDPDTQRLEQIGDVGRAVGHRRGDHGFGKIHGQMVADRCGSIYLATYWGSQKEAASSLSYQGDHLLRLDPWSGVLTDLGIPIPGHGIPSLAGWAVGGLIYGEAADPATSPEGGRFFVYDTERGEVVFSEAVRPHAGFRSIMVDADGRAYFSAGEGRLQVYDPVANAVTEAPWRIPGAILRAASQPGPDGTVYGVTDDPTVLFSLSQSSPPQVLGPVRGYVTSIALDPSGERLYYVPDAHGGSWRSGTPIIEVDTRSGDERVLTTLVGPVNRELGLVPGGSYNLAMDPSGRRLFVGLNAGPDLEVAKFGSVVLVVLELP